MRRDGPFDHPAALLQQPQLARVVSLQDPESMNRVQVRLIGCDASPGHDALLWARVVLPFAGKDRGAFFFPDVDDEVLVVFQGGDERFPLVLGGLWNGNAPPPAQLSGGRNETKRITSANGVQITLTDKSGQEELKLETPGGQSLTLHDGPGEVTVEDSNGNSIKLDSQGITINAAAKVKVQAANVEVSAGMVKVDTAIDTFTGIVKCELLQTNTVISSAYTPGAGNIW
jgi:uncharacterized protein involved in type VI secretion and phage assembly